MDFAILDFIQNLRCDVLDKIMAVVTHAGDMGLFWIVLGIILLFFKKTRKCGILMLLSLALCAVLTSGVIKPLVGRVRPFAQRGIEPYITPPMGSSFPSGHTSSSFTAATSVWMFDKKYGKASFIMAFLIALSRLYFYVHFPSDVLAGAVVGVVCAVGMRRLISKPLNIE